MRLVRHVPPEPSKPAQERAVPPDDSSSDLLDVPAAVVCARCGDVDCPGCDGDLARSGIIAVIPWERSQLPFFSRLWTTARASSRDAERFFEGLPDGPLLPALRFALVCELIAVTTMLLAFVPFAVLAAPAWTTHLAGDPSARAVTLRVLVVGIPAFSAILVGAHAAHGYAIDLGARRSGARSASRRAVRFGLYACGWDLMMGPFGVVVSALKEGVRAALSVIALATGRLPTRATTAFLRGTYALEAEGAARALTTSYVGAIVATLAGVFIVALAFVALAFG